MPSSIFLGFPDGGPSLHFRVNPEQIEWDFKIHTRVFNTIGGRVIQVLGGALSDLTITGSIGEDFDAIGDEGDWEGESWRLHEAFLKRVREMMQHQSRDATIHREYSSRMHQPATFRYSEKGWNFTVYIKSIEDLKGGSITHHPARVNHQYRLTLFIVEDAASSLTRVKSDAIRDYIDRISDGIGWRYSDFNGEGWENLDPYGDTWGEELDLSEFEDEEETESEGDEVAGDGSVSESDSPDAGAEASGGANASRPGRPGGSSTRRRGDVFDDGGGTGESQSQMRGVDPDSGGGSNSPGATPPLPGQGPLPGMPPIPGQGPVPGVPPIPGS